MTPVPSALTSAEPATTVQPVASNDKPPAAKPALFQAVIALPAKAKFFPVQGATLVLAEGYPEPKEGEYHIPLGVIEGDQLTFPERLRVPAFMSLVHTIDGSWPDKIDMLATGTTGRTGSAEHWVLGKKQWELKKASENSLFGGLASVGSSLIALRMPALAFPGTRSDIVALRGNLEGRKLTAINPDCKKGLDAEQAAYLPTTDLQPQAFGASGAGSLFALGARCNEKYAVELWPAGSKSSSVVEVESAGFEGVDIATAPGTNEAWVLSSPALHFDGSAWKPHKAHNFVAGALAADGTLWAIDDKAKLYAGKAEAFEEIAVGAPVDDVAVASDGTVWISAGGALHRTKRANDGQVAVKVASSAPAASGKPKKAPPKAGGPKCKTNVVVLYGFTKVTPDDYDFPLSRKALKGHTEFKDVRFVVTKDYGQKFFSGLAPSFNDAKKLAALIEKEVKGSKPQVVCAEPEILRELKLDLKTGEVQK